MIGEVIGHFEIVARAGRGGMGEVFVAEHTSIKTRVAIKVLHAEVSANTKHVQRFFNEARAVAQIQHAGIVKIFDVGFHASKRAYLIMEHLEGETLAARLQARGRLALRDAAELARQIASILCASHDAGIVHRDLKPENVFLVRDRELAGGERVKLLDFGIAKLSNKIAGAGPTTLGAIGTPAYMAPEQWSDASTVDWRADVYSLGCMLYKMAIGRTPFLSDTIAEACAKHLGETPTPLRFHVPTIPAAFDAFTLRLLAKEPARRVASTEALEHELAALGASAPSEAPAPAAGLEETQPAVTTLSGVATSAPRRPPRPRMTVAVAALGALAIAIVVAWRTTRSDEVPAVTPPRDAAVTPRDAAVTRRDAAVAVEPPLVTWLAAENPFVAWRGARWLAHQVTRREYRAFLESLPVADALRFQPVTGWSDRDPARPVAWVTFERAAAFCRAIQAALPTSEAWLAASAGAWGLDPQGTGQPGPLQEWTATEHDGLVVVRGGHERMSPGARAAAAREPLMKSSEAQAGPGAAPNVVASETIGFRCVRGAAP